MNGNRLPDYLGQTAQTRFRVVEYARFFLHDPIPLSYPGIPLNGRGGAPSPVPV